MVLPRGRLQTVTARRGEGVTRVCVGQGTPPPSVSWYRVGAAGEEPLMPGPGRQVQGELLLLTAGLEAAGSYLCRVSSRLGEVSSTWVLEVEEELGAELPGLVRARLGGRAELSCRVRSAPRHDREVNHQTSTDWL